MSSSPEIEKAFEMEYLRLIAEMLESGDIDFKTAKESATELLTLSPYISNDDMQIKIQKFTEKYKMLEKIYVFLLQLLEKEKTNALVEKMRDLMKSNNIDEALNLAPK